MSEKINPEDFLKKHLESLESSNNVNSNSIVFDDVITEQKSSNRTQDLQYIAVSASEFPCGKFYPIGTNIMVRSAEVREIQSYAMVMDDNLYDVVDKMNDILQSCVRVKFPDGRVSSFLSLKDQDRIYAIFLIRELTFQNGNKLSIKKKCPHCNTQNDLELVRVNFVKHNIVDKLDKYFRKDLNGYLFELKNGKEFKIVPPTIGLQKSFTEFIIEKRSKEEDVNMSFLKIAPFLLDGRTSITKEGIESKIKEFENMDDISFQFLNDVVSKMKLGISEVKKSCSSCGEEVRTKMDFPNGASGIFIVPDAFETFIKD